MVERHIGGTAPEVITPDGRYLHPLNVVYEQIHDPGGTGLREAVATALKPPAW